MWKPSKLALGVLGVGALLLLAKSAGAAESSVVFNLPKGWSAAQKENARIIDAAFRDVISGCTDQLVMAAIANAYRESGLNAGAKGDSSSGTPHSFGLFQCNVYGAGSGWDPADLLDADTNARIMAEICAGKGKKGKAVIAAMKAGGSAQELADLFCRNIEQPAHPTAQADKSRALVVEFFGNV